MNQYTKGARLYYDDSKDLYEGLITEIDEQGIQSQVAQVYPAYREEYGRLFASSPLLYEKLNKVRKWLVQLASSAEKKIETERFITLRDAYIADAKMYRATIADIDKALAFAEGKEK